MIRSYTNKSWFHQITNLFFFLVFSGNIFLYFTWWKTSLYQQNSDFFLHSQSFQDNSFFSTISTVLAHCIFCLSDGKWLNNGLWQLGTYHMRPLSLRSCLWKLRKGFTQNNTAQNLKFGGNGYAVLLGEDMSMGCNVVWLVCPLPTSTMCVSSVFGPFSLRVSLSHFLDSIGAPEYQCELLSVMPPPSGRAMKGWLWPPLTGG